MKENIHLRKLFGGRMTAMDVHRKYAWHGARCQACHGPPDIRINSYLPLVEYRRRVTEIGALLFGKGNPTQEPATYPTIYGPMVPVSVIYACGAHKQAAETAAARAPSYYLVEIDRGPGEDKVVVQVPRSYKSGVAKA